LQPAFDVEPKRSGVGMAIVWKGGERAAQDLAQGLRKMTEIVLADSLGPIALNSTLERREGFDEGVVSRESFEEQEAQGVDQGAAIFLASPSLLGTGVEGVLFQTQEKREGVLRGRAISATTLESVHGS
jgi:hypothetical protein